jgi:hypothetical protein
MVKNVSNYPYAGRTPDWRSILECTYFAQINYLAKGVLFILDNDVSYVPGSTVPSQKKQGGFGKMYMYMCTTSIRICYRVLKFHDKVQPPI